MAGAWTFGLLGELEISKDGGPVPLRTGKLRVLLATLLLRANRTVSADELIERLWGDAAPDKAWTTAQAYVMRLRQALGDDTRLIQTRPGGYLIGIDAHQLDLL
jgi:DNA-binding SARP family transcriptional activator